ncbi:hypothetical protein [Mesorhizobium sp. CAU 1732]|uniref:hypothetical protein n=1 Tax=Mesorhizobium sp. CAU 1732 TaxID=3140358 RepID=UPI0032601D95
MALQFASAIMAHAAYPVPVRSSFMLKVFLTFVLLALLSVAISIGGRMVGRTIAMAGHTDDLTVHDIVIGKDTLAVPANMIRFDASRRSGVTQRLDLYLNWPLLEGYSNEARDDFNHTGDTRNILFLSFEERMMSRDMSGRLEPIYRALVEGTGRPGPGGLTVYSFSEKSGYMDEILIVGDGDTDTPFVARCLSGDASRESLAACERDIHLGNGLSLSYRMPAELAGSWRDVDAAIREKAESFIVKR